MGRCFFPSSFPRSGGTALRIFGTLLPIIGVLFRNAYFRNGLIRSFSAALSAARNNKTKKEAIDADFTIIESTTDDRKS
jgi:hypothetical protein